jgi:hypothetical protein
MATNPIHPEQSRSARRWDSRLTRYRRLAESAKAAAETGWFRAANDRYNREFAAADEGQRKAAFTRVTKAENLYYDRHTAPLMRAATLLAATPAPDLAALLAKICVMQAHELQEEGALPKPALELLAEDAGRLARH